MIQQKNEFISGIDKKITENRKLLKIKEQEIRESI
jgi:hypothetical protein